MSLCSRYLRWTAPTGAFPILSVLAVAAAAPASPPAPTYDLRQEVAGWLERGAARVRRLEFVEMISAIAAGSRMGPGDGWFHPGQRGGR